jgi:hypothetical protein
MRRSSVLKTNLLPQHGPESSSSSFTVALDASTGKCTGSGATSCDDLTECVSCDRQRSPSVYCDTLSVRTQYRPVLPNNPVTVAHTQSSCSEYYFALKVDGPVLKAVTMQ